MKKKFSGSLFIIVLLVTITAGYRYGGGGSGERKTWPELVGLPSEEAERRIKEEKPGINVRIIPPDSMVTMDFRTDRVRIFTDTSGKVSRAPMIG